MHLSNSPFFFLWVYESLLPTVVCALTFDLQVSHFLSQQPLDDERSGVCDVVSVKEGDKIKKQNYNYKSGYF